MKSLVLGLALTGIAGGLGGCTSDFEIREVEVLSLMGPDSVAAGEPLTMVYAMQTSGGSVFHRWHALNDSTYVLTVLERYKEDDGGLAPLNPSIETRSSSHTGPSPLEPATSPAYPRTKTAVLEDPPPRRFVIQASGLVFRVQGGADPAKNGQLTVEIQDGAGAPVPEVALRLDEGEQSVLFDPTDASGSTTTTSTCLVPGETFRIESISPDPPHVWALGRWPADCAISTRLVTAIL